MGLAFRAAIRLQLLDHRFDLLGLGAIGDQNCIIRFHHHQVLDAKTHHQAVFAAQIAVATVLVDHPPLQHVAVTVTVGGFPERTPAAHVTPAGIQRQHRTQLRLLHYRHINGHVGALGEGFPLQSQKVEICGVLFKGGTATAHHLRCQALQLRQHGAGPEQEHAAVPGEAARGQELLCGGPVRFFHEAGDRHLTQGSAAEGFGRLDVAVAGFRSGRNDPEGHQATGLCSGSTGIHRLAELLRITDQVVGRQYQQQWVLPPSCGLQRCHRDRRRRVPPHWFQQDGVGFNADLPHLLGHDEAMVFIADQQRCLEAIETLQPLLGLLHQGGITLPAEGPVLLRVTGAGQWPPSRAGPAAEDHRDQRGAGHTVHR